MIKFDDENKIITQESYRAILVGLQCGEDIAYSMDELEGLAEAADAQVLGRMIQNLERPNTATFIGKGKVEELAEMCTAMEVDTVIFNDELSGMQIRNLEEAVGVRVIDRTILVLDIFAARATSREGKLQVELAQLKYRVPRLLGFGKSLSRLGGGIGTRGPGEKKLETDRRHIERRIDDIKAELAQLKNTRKTQRAKREKAEIPVIALVGYTNSGKSALMNKFLEMSEKEDKVVFEKDMLFATLDTAQRLIHLDSHSEFILIDTVGFVSKLPHALVNAFKATLEEVAYADLIFHVVDLSDGAYDFRIDVTRKVIKEIGAGNTPQILVYNKIDKLDVIPVTVGGPESVLISAKRGDNIDNLVALIREKLFSDKIKATLLIPYDKGNISSYLCEKTKVVSTEYLPEGTKLVAELPLADYRRLAAYETKE